MSKKDTVVLIPSWGMGHIIPFTELAKLLTTTTTFSVAILLFDAPFDVSTTIDPLIASITSTHSSISFHRLPQPTLPRDYVPNGAPLSLDLLRFINPQLTHFLASFSETCSIRAIILDMFCAVALDVAREFHLPAYFFYSSSVFILAFFGSLPAIHAQRQTHLKDIGETPFLLPGLPSFPASCIPEPFLNDEDEIFKVAKSQWEQYRKADGILVNTFEAIEPNAIKAVEDGLHGPMPPVYCIGPLIADKSIEEGEKHLCLKWLDEQPKGSVVFLCFGSLGVFSAEQVNEIAVGLERSGQRFLWVVRSPKIGTDSNMKEVGLGESNVEGNIDEFLPEGFVERTKGRGMVVKNWAPQTEVLAHEAVGGFVTHCGWNSILEGASAGLAMIAWPLYAEQKMNIVFLVEEAKVAVKMEGCDEHDEVVKRNEVEKKVRWLMESEGGRELKERARAMGDNATKARKIGGSSDAAWKCFVDGLKN